MPFDGALSPRTQLEILQRARDLLDQERAWCQGAFIKIRGAISYDTDRRQYQLKEPVVARCIVGAIAEAVGNTDPHYPTETESRLFETIFPCISWRYRLMARWQIIPDQLMRAVIISHNDDRSTTHADVIRLLDRAIVRSRRAIKTKA